MEKCIGEGFPYDMNKFSCPKGIIGQSPLLDDRDPQSAISSNECIQLFLRVCHSVLSQICHHVFQAGKNGAVIADILIIQEPLQDGNALP